MKTISEKAGCSLIYTNHSLRATTVTVLDEAGVAGRDIDIMAVTGHKSESSLKHYVRTSNAKKQDMSTIISSQMQENIPVARKEPAESIFDDLVLTDSQEQFLFSESNLIIQSSLTLSSTTQHFHFHGPVVFNNK
jgi:hypothetical protein